MTYKPLKRRKENKKKINKIKENFNLIIFHFVLCCFDNVFLIYLEQFPF